MGSRSVTVSETTGFRRSAAAIMDAEEIEILIDFIAGNPSAGTLIPGAGGIRKLRWQRPGMGKRGGARVIYYYHDDTMPILLLLAYAKAEADDLTADQKRRMTTLVREWTEHWQT